MKLCRLCLINEANQKNSHIIPRFFKWFISNDKRQMLFYNLKSQKEQLKQELPRVDFLLCSDCENKLSKIEKHCSILFSKFHKIDFARSFPSITTLFEGKSVSYRVASYLDSYTFSLFIISIVWRAANSENPFKISLPNSFNEKIRKQLCDYFIDNNIRHKDYYSYVIITPEHISKRPFSNISIVNAGVSIILLSLGHFMINFSTDMCYPETELSYYMYALQNGNSSETLKIGTGNIDTWNKHNENLIKQFLKTQ